MQIISGKYRGRKLALPAGARPTQNKARIALFNMLESGIINHGDPMFIWDAFAGSGAFGIEFLSRYSGADVKFTDLSRDSIETVRRNLNGIDGGTVEQIDALGAAGKYGAMSDIIFVDPPYSDPDLGPAFVRKLAPVVKPGTIIVWEIEDGADFRLSDTDWDVLRDKTYGRARFLILEKI